MNLELFFNIVHSCFSISAIISYIVYFTRLRKIVDLPTIMATFVWMLFWTEAFLFGLLLFTDYPLDPVDIMFYKWELFVDILAFLFSILICRNLDSLFRDDVCL